jgi:hypothetical protein
VILPQAKFSVFDFLAAFYKTPEACTELARDQANIIPLTTPLLRTLTAVEPHRIMSDE